MACTTGPAGQNEGLCVERLSLADPSSARACTISQPPPLASPACPTCAPLQPPPSHTSIHRMADAMILFLFASQDASTASLVWCLTLMADNPDMLAKVSGGLADLAGRS